VGPRFGYLRDFSDSFLAKFAETPNRRSSENLPSTSFGK
jgi:hypothetical protein